MRGFTISDIMLVHIGKEVSMIQPIKAITGKTTVTNPIAINPAAAYKNIYSQRGEKLNINCNEVRSLTRDGLKLDYLA